MNAGYIFNELENNSDMFQTLLYSFSIEQALWKPEEKKWSALEIVCHLYDEERDDFRARFKHVLENRQEPLPSIDPVAWVSERNYASKDFLQTIEEFIAERRNSVEWLRSLKDIPLDNFYEHPKFGRMTTKMFLANWLAHDYLHIRQLLKNKYAYLMMISGEGLDYAGPSML